MRIYEMTATFGTLEHKTLTLKPNLNIIEAPNEWGKSTWCAFLVNMLYGLDTRARSTKDSLADKNRYAPWSGLPMSGRIDLNWNGRDITIERRTQGRLIFGEFSAYETATGLEIPELNGSNCGQMLLGVERSVFTRSGFLKLTDLPVTQDEALRRRLNALVTTGDESGAGDKLYQALKDLKNKCRYNKTGLLPQAEAQRQQLEGQLYELSQLQEQCAQLAAEQTEVKKQLSALENHRLHLLYEESLEDANKVQQAKDAWEEAKAVFDSLSQHCDGLPDKETADAKVAQGHSLQQQWLALQRESASLPPLPQAVPAPDCYRDLSARQVVEQAEKDTRELQATICKRKSKKRTTLALILTAGLVLIIAAVLHFALTMLPFIPFAVIGAVGICVLAFAAITGAVVDKKLKSTIQSLSIAHPGIQMEDWVSHAQAYARQLEQYEADMRSATAQRGDLDQKLQHLDEEIAAFAKDAPLDEVLEHWQQISQSLLRLEMAKQDSQQAKNLLDTLRSMVKVTEKPDRADHLTETLPETEEKLQQLQLRLHQLQQRLGQAQGRSEAMGQEDVLRSQLKAVSNRIQRLEDMYHALELAMTALTNATAELQRRFAPRISKRAEELFRLLTHGRYQQFSLSDDLSVRVRAENEDNQRNAEERSDGTVDQLYLALRLAVSEALTPEAPLILDDALVRFDDRRLEAALTILQEFSQNKQVILFTCQGRENALLAP